jgi:tetratricopeptide (TPR) repeat protein
MDGLPPTVTFSGQVAPIIFRHCAPCHQAGQLAPFSLLSYGEVRSEAERILAAIEDRRMPPWLPEPGHGDFANARALTAAEVDVIRRWVRDGAPEGDPAELPSVQIASAGWQLGQPDLVLELPEQYTLSAARHDSFRNFVIPVPLAARRYVRGVEFQPGNATVIHHAVIGLDRTRTSRRLDRADNEPGYEGMFADTFENPDGFFVGWTPGRAPAFEPGDLAWALEPGVDLVLQLHMLPPADGSVTVGPRIGLFFTDTPPRRAPSLLKLGTTTIDIPPGERAHVVSDRFVLPVDVEVLSVYPHAHYLAREMIAVATLPDGSAQSLLRIRNWDFMWQDVYRFRVPPRLPRGAVLEMRYTYDNSETNPRNPHRPPARVVYGPRSADEMGDLWLQVLTTGLEDAATLGRAQASHRLELGLRAAEHMAQTNPRDAGSRNFLGAQYLRTGRLDDAIVQLRTALELNPRHGEAFNNLGLAEQARGRLTAAVQAFRQAAALRPGDDAVHLNLANALSAAGQVDEAIGHWRRALTINPDSADAHNNLGQALGSRQRIDEAIAHFEQAIAIAPGNADAYNNLAIALGARGQLDQAIAHARRALELRPDHPDARSNLDFLLKTRSTPR